MQPKIGIAFRGLAHVHPTYDQDYYQWLGDQVRLLREGLWERIDVEALIIVPAKT